MAQNMRSKKCKKALENTYSKVSLLTYILLAMSSIYVRQN